MWRVQTMRILSAFSLLAAIIPWVLTASVPLKIDHRPSIVLVPGAWHSPEHFQELRRLLERNGYHTFSQRNPSCNSKAPNDESAAKDTEFIRNQVLMPLLDAGKTVVLAMHSYGGLPGAAAARGLSQRERHAAGQPGGILGLIFINALVAQDGRSLLSMLPGQQFDPWVIQKNNGQLHIDNPKKIFYGLVPTGLVGPAISLLKPQSRASLSTPGGPPAWSEPAFDNRRAYWVSLQDQSIPSVAQEGMIQGSGVEWAVKRFPSDHSPFLSFPEELFSWMVQTVHSWQETP